MKIYSKLVLLPLGMVMIGCSHNANSDNARADYSDSPSQEAVQQMEVKPTVSEETIDSIYKEGLNIEVGSPSKKWVGDSTDPDITLPVTVSNEMGITLYPEDYTITYTVEEMGDDIEFDDCTVKKKRTAKGSEIPAGESIQVTLFERCALKISKVKAKLNISREDFAERYREANP